jgi:hypothetical protein
MIRLLASLALFLIAGLALPPAAISDEKPPAVASSPESQDAKALLMRMAEFLAKTKAFSMTMNAGYDVVQDSGQKIEFGEIRQVMIDRPNHLRVQLELSNGEKERIYFDGKNIIVFSPKENVFARLEKSGTVDGMLKYVIQDLKIPISLALLLASSVKEELEKRTTEVAYVERTNIGGKPVDHLAGRMADVDFQIWLQEGEQPLPLRAIITYKQAVGQPQFSANLSDWNLAPKIEDAAFEFSPPAGAEPIPLMVSVPAVAARKKAGGNR